MFGQTLLKIIQINSHKTTFQTNNPKLDIFFSSQHVLLHVIFIPFDEFLTEATVHKETFSRRTEKRRKFP